MKKPKMLIILTSLVAMLLFIIILGVSVGTLKIPVSDTYSIIIEKIFKLEPVNETYYGVIWKVRMPRVLMGLIIGAGLSLCGIVMQAVVQNPLAERYLLGISAGGYLGETIFIILGNSVISIFNGAGLAFTAFIGALFAAISVLFLASFKSNITTTKLILSG